MASLYPMREFDRTESTQYRSKQLPRLTGHPAVRSDYGPHRRSGPKSAQGVLKSPQKIGSLGFEPRMSESESEVLPLHYEPVVGSQWSA